MSEKLSLSEVEAIRTAYSRFASSDDVFSVGVRRVIGDDGSVAIRITRPGKAMTKRAA